MRVCLFTGTRAEFGLLQPVVRALEALPGVEPEWLVSGMHMLQEYGNTVDLVRADAAPIRAALPYFADGVALAASFAFGVSAFGESLNKGPRPDWLVVLGDRHESMAATLAAAFNEIPIAHIHGGDKADSGHMDESLRHAMTRFAHLHFPASVRSAERIVRFGEEVWRIHRCGAPGIDRLRALSMDYSDEIAAWGAANPTPFLLVIFHPVSIEAEQAGKQARVLFEALDKREEHKLAIYPNNDPGGEAILQELKRREGSCDWTLTQNLPAVEYAAALKFASAMVGNSSSGIIEAPFFGLPMVHAGMRNLDREHAGHVHFVEFDKSEINAALSKAVSEDDHKRASELANPYGDGSAGPCIAEKLVRYGRDPRLMRKLLTY